MNILIIGYGVVGHNMQKVFPMADIHDPSKGKLRDPNKKYDVAFVCVPTPMNKDGSCNFQIVEQVLIEHGNVDVFCLRSTVPPGTTDYFIRELNERVVFCPEYYGETIHANGVYYDFIILGGLPQARTKVAEAFKKVMHSNTKIIMSSALDAEMAKYMENAALAMRVTFCNEIYRICKRVGADYNIVRELWLMDPRMNRSHTFVYEDQPFYETICLDKDVPALVAFAENAGYDPMLIKQIIASNERFKQTR